MIKKILKNVSGQTLQILNRSIADGEQYDIPHGQWGKLADDTIIPSLISSEDIIVNNGVQDLSIAVAQLYIKDTYSNIQISIEDENPGLLEDKIVQGDGIAISTIGDASNKQLRITNNINSNLMADMTMHFGNEGSLDKKYLQMAGGSKVASNESTIGFPRPIKIIGYYIDSSKNPNRSWIIQIKEKDNLSVNKATIIKPHGQLSTYSYDIDNPITTFATNERISVYVEKGSQSYNGKANNPKITFWFRWND